MPRLFLIFPILFTCCAHPRPQGTHLPDMEKKEYHYANIKGDELQLLPHSDSTVRAIFTNRTGFVFDTTLNINTNMRLVPLRDSLPFLSLRTGGLSWGEDQVMAYDFGGPAYMAMYSQVHDIHSLPFYRLGVPTKLRGNWRHSKAGVTIEGIYLKDAERNRDKDRYIEVHGVISKEEYPVSYYSTPESPQGMFSDTSIAHYRLIFNEYEIHEIAKTTFTGSSINIAGQAAFIYDFADSEVFFLDRDNPWKTEELNKKITIKAILVQAPNGKSMLKNWEIVE